MFTLNGYCLPIRDMTEVIKGEVRRISTHRWNTNAWWKLTLYFYFGVILNDEIIVLFMKDSNG